MLVAGKAVSSQNSLLHGISGRHVVLPREDDAAFERLFSRLESALMTLIAAGEDVKPATPDQRIASYMLSKSGDALAKVLRYATAAQRVYYRALKQPREIDVSRAEIQVSSTV